MAAARIEQPALFELKEDCRRPPPSTVSIPRTFATSRFATDSPLEGTGFEPSVPLLRKALLGVANRRRRHERRSHLQVQVRNGNACLEWLPTALPFAEGPRVRIRLPPAVSQRLSVPLKTTPVVRLGATAFTRIPAFAYSIASDLVAAARPHLVIDLSEPHKVEHVFGKPYGEEEIRLSDQRVKAWERDVLLRVRLAIDHAADSPGTDWLRYILQSRLPGHSFPRVRCTRPP
jgi:hypothetical protein